MTSDRIDDNALAQWAEDEMDAADATTTLRGDDAAQHGRDLIEWATRGRPRLDPSEEPGTRSPRRQVRVPQALSDQIDEIAQAAGKKPAEVMREAFVEYVQRHQAPPHLTTSR